MVLTAGAGPGSQKVPGGRRRCGGREAPAGQHAPAGREERRRPRTTGPLARSRFTVWAPTRRTHLLCLACAAPLTLAGLIQATAPSATDTAAALLGGACVALISVWPLGAAGLSLVLVPAVHMLVSTPVFLVPGIVPWLCACVLVSRGFHRGTAYAAVAVGTVEELGAYLWVIAPSQRELYPDHHPLGFQSFLTDYYMYVLVLGAGCLVVAELLRAPRAQTEASARRFEADLERQRLLVVSELHDTVVRDLTHAVMLAEQARLSAGPQDSMADELAAMTGSVRVAVEQLRSSLRAMGQVAGGAGLDVLASSAPRPLSAVLAEARTLLAARGVELEVSGLEALEREEVTPGVRQQLVRVLSELVVNMSKYAAPGPARVLVESDGASLEAMVSNTADGGQATQALTSGLGLEGARRRVEALGGVMSVDAGGRFTVVLSVPLGAG